MNCALWRVGVQRTRVRARWVTSIRRRMQTAALEAVMGALPNAAADMTTPVYQLCRSIVVIS